MRERLFFIWGFTTIIGCIMGAVLFLIGGGLGLAVTITIICFLIGLIGTFLSFE